MLQWLLIITMMIQPALFSHAMASMDHGYAAAQTQIQIQIQIQIHEMDPMNNDVGHDASSGHHAHDGMPLGTTVDNCCHTPACGPALIVDVVLMLQPSRSFYSRALYHSLYGVDLPVSIKPPRLPV